MESRKLSQTALLQSLHKQVQEKTNVSWPCLKLLPVSAGKKAVKTLTVFAKQGLMPEREGLEDWVSYHKFSIDKLLERSWLGTCTTR